MSSFVALNGVVGVQPIAEASDTQNHPLGTRMRAKDIDSTAYGEGEFIYVKGVASCAVGSALLINPDDYSTSLAVANDIGEIGFAMAAIGATQYGWAQIYGKAVGKVLTGFADNANVYLTATAGSLDDAVVAGDRVKNCKGASAIGTPAAGLAELEIAYPSVDDGLAA